MADSDDHGSERSFLRGGGATGALIASHDWAATPLGPLRAWPQSLKTATSILLSSTVPMVMLWGADGVMIYNDAYSVFAGSRHPRLLGCKVREGWPEVAEFNDQVMEVGLAGGTLAFRDQELTLYRSGRPEQVWMNLDYSPVLDESGKPAGVLAIVVETTQRVLAERNAAAQRERQRRMFAQAPGFIAILSGPDHVFEFANEAHKRLFGDRGVVGKPLREAFPELEGQGFYEDMDRVYATGERYIARAEPTHVRRTPDGPEEDCFLDFVFEPVSGDDGEIIGIFCEGFDVTEQVRAQQAIAESEKRLSAAIAIARLGAFEWDADSDTVTLDDRAREIFGFDPETPVTLQDVFDRIDPSDFPRVHAEVNAAHAAIARLEIEYRVNLPDGTARTVVSLSDVVAGPDGRPRRTIGVFDDVTERRRAEKRQRLLINELNHRVKNTLATVQSIGVQTLRSAPDLASARDSYEARLVALAAAHDLLTARSWNGALLGDVVRTAMAAFETDRQPQISRSGPHVWLNAQPALALSMALHELATNAVKYGALSQPEGRVTIRWILKAKHQLAVSWVESGGPPVTPPTHAGFGSRLLQRSLARELDGEVVVSFAPEGLRCEIRCTVEDPRPSRTREMAGA